MATRKQDRNRLFFFSLLPPVLSDFKTLLSLKLHLSFCLSRASFSFSHGVSASRFAIIFSLFFTAVIVFLLRHFCLFRDGEFLSHLADATNVTFGNYAEAQ
jgi:hypothetical protein